AARRGRRRESTSAGGLRRGRGLGRRFRPGDAPAARCGQEPVPVGLQGLLYVLDAALGVGAAIRGPDDVQFALRGRLADEVVHVGEGGFVVLALAFFALGAGGLREFVRGVRVYGRVVVLHASLH